MKFRLSPKTYFDFHWSFSNLSKGLAIIPIDADPFKLTPNKVVTQLNSFFIKDFVPSKGSMKTTAYSKENYFCLVNKLSGIIYFSILEKSTELSYLASSSASSSPTIFIPG